LRVAGRELTGVTVVDLDATIVFAAAEKENAQATYKGGVGFCPNLATCDNTDDVLAVDPRPGGATSNCAAEGIALPDLAVSRLPGRYRRRLLVRLDRAGFSRDLLTHIAAGGGTRGRHWELSVGWSCTDTETDATERLPKGAWTVRWRRVRGIRGPVESAGRASLPAMAGRASPSALAGCGLRHRSIDGDDPDHG
jgi:hypothetical protein